MSWASVAIAELARGEGLPAHAKSAEYRMKQIKA